MTTFGGLGGKRVNNQAGTKLRKQQNSGAKKN